MLHSPNPQVYFNDMRHGYESNLNVSVHVPRRFNTSSKNRASNKSLLLQNTCLLCVLMNLQFRVSVHLIYLSFQHQYDLILYFQCSADSSHCVSCYPPEISDSAISVYYKSSLFPVFTGQSRKHPNVCNSSLITKQPDRPSCRSASGPSSAGLIVGEEARKVFSLNDCQLTNSSLWFKSDGRSIRWIKEAQREYALCL